MSPSGAVAASPRPIVIVGQEPLVTLAAAIAAARRGADRVRTVPLTPDRIAAFDAATLAQDPPGNCDAFAAIGLSALNYARFDLWAKLRLAGYRCATLVHPAASVDPSATIGDNVLIGPNAAIEPGSSIGAGTIIHAGALVGTSSRIGAWCWLARGAVVGAQGAVGEHVVLGSGVQLHEFADLPGPAEIDVAGTYRGKFAPGTFVSPEFPGSARWTRGAIEGRP